MIWPWNYLSSPTRTHDGTGRAGQSTGGCCRCGEYGMILLNGQTLYCWEHYCGEMQRQRDIGYGQSTDNGNP